MRWFLVIGWGALGCMGVVADADAPDVPISAGVPTSAGGSPRLPDARAASTGTCRADDVGLGSLQRLTNAEYDNTIADLLGDVSHPAGVFPDDDVVAGFTSNAAFGITRLGVDEYQQAAEILAANAVKNMSALVSCDPQKVGASACATTFIRTFGRRALRRPLTAQEESELAGLHATGDTFQEGVQLVVQAVLQSPYFLYRVEAGSGTSGAVVSLTQHEVATRLSYFLWNTMPDQELRTAADEGRLGDGAALDAQVQRLLASDRARAAMNEFHDEWLHLTDIASLSKDTKVFPAFTPTLVKAMGQETELLADYLLRRGDARLETLLRGTTTFANAELAKLYGRDLVRDRVDLPVPAPALPAGFAPIALDGRQRAGVLTHASVLATNAKAGSTDVIKRGKLLREQLLLCSHLPDPPPGVPELPTPDPNVPLRQQLQQHRTSPQCASCHSLTDELGFGLEDYDGIGRFRAVDQFNHPIDSRAELTGSDVDGTFHGGVDLATKLAASDQVRQCMVKQWFRYALGRGESERDACTLDGVTAAFRARGYDLRAMIAALVRSNAFTALRKDP